MTIAVRQRAPGGERLTPAEREALSRAIQSRGIRPLGQEVGVSADTLARAAAGCIVTRASRTVIRMWLASADGEPR
ncbi:MAG: hypothetical protein ACRDFW_11220 [bacterium]